MPYQPGMPPRTVDPKVNAIISAIWKEFLKVSKDLLALDSSVVRVLERSGTNISINSPNLFAKLTGLAGVVIGSAGIRGTDSLGVDTFFLNAASGAATFKGSITASSMSASSISGSSIDTSVL